MRWLQTEYILKGLFLGLLLVAAVQQGLLPPSATAETLLPVNLGMLGGLVAALLVGAIFKLLQGYRPQGLFTFLLFVLLECPTLVYLGILGGLCAGLFPFLKQEPRELTTVILGGGAALGLVMGILKEVKDRNHRIFAILVLAAGLVAGAYYAWGYAALGEKIQAGNPSLFAIQLLLGLPFFYLLTFAGQEEETEVEIGAICALLSIAAWILVHQAGALGFQMTALFVPLALYLLYTLYILPGLRVAKHAFRGYSYARVGRYRQALLAFRRALHLDPTNSLARDGFWDVHKALDLNDLARDPELLALVDFDLCLERAGTLLVARPTPRQLDEALRLLELVLSQRPQLRPAYDYWHAVASTHQGNLDDACERLLRILDPDHYGRASAARSRMLMAAWQLALQLHPVLRQRVGLPQIVLPGRRMEAIAAVERVLAEAPEDPGARQLKQELYREVTRDEYVASLPEGEHVAREFDHDHVRRLGLILVADAERWQHGVELLRLAIRGMPELAVGLYAEVAKAYERAGQSAEARTFFEKARDAGRQMGFRNLAETEQQMYFRVVRHLADLCLYLGETDKAIENFKLYTEAPNSGIETFRTLAELYEQTGDLLAAIRATEAGLCYNSQDRDLLDKKDRYYYSLEPDVLKANLEHMHKTFDTTYCITKAKTILDDPQYSRPTETEPERARQWLDVARHLAELAIVAAPANVGAKLILGRILLRYGERDEAIAILEDARAKKPTSWLSGDEEDAWYVAQQILGDLYLEAGRFGEALPCFQDFLKSHRAGAKTYFKIAQCWEGLGEKAKAIKAYKQVTAYEGNPLSSDAYDALHRLGA